MTLRSSSGPVGAGRRRPFDGTKPSSSLQLAAAPCSDKASPAWRTPAAFRKAGVRLARGSVADQGLAAAGVGAAIAAAGFAGYMIARDNSRPVFGGAEHLMLFARPRGPVQSPGSGDDGVAGRPIDFEATGSIDRAAGRQRESDAADSRGREGDPSIKPDRPRPGASGAGYILRFVHKGVAIVQKDGKSYVVAPGASLPTAGRVLSIEKRGGGWVVMTASGAIVGAP